MHVILLVLSVAQLLVNSVSVYARSSQYFCSNGWMNWGFMSLSTVFQSYQDDGRVNMKGSVQ